MSHARRDADGPEHRSRVIIRIAGDSGDGIQLLGQRVTADAALAGNDLATLPDFPAEIRAPAGTLPGVSAFQLQFADGPVQTPGDRPDVLVALNPAALRSQLSHLPAGGTLLLNSDEFTARALTKAGYAADPRHDGSLRGFQVHEVALTTMATRAVAATDAAAGLGKKDAERTRNMCALGLLSWLYQRPLDGTEQFLQRRFARRADLAAANIAALRAGHAYGETTEAFAVRYTVAPAPMPAGTYRTVTGNTALAYGLVAASVRSGLPLFLGSYPITPASDVLHALAGLKRFGVITFQAEDEIAGIGAALGAAYGGALGVSTTSGPGLALKSETLGLAVALELPLVVIDIQRGGPSTGLPTKTEQADLLQALFGRNGEAPLPVLAARSPADCFDTALEAVRVATVYRTPVVLLSDGYLANGSEPWRVPAAASLPDLRVAFATAPNGPDGVFLPYARDPETLARPWAVPGTPGLAHRIGGLEKADLTGAISYEPDNHDRMVRLRAAKVEAVAATLPPLVVDDPGADAELLVLGWGSTYGPIAAGCALARQRGLRVAAAHLRYLQPFPTDLAAVLRRYPRVLLPELNLGQLALLLRARYLVDIASYTQVRGLPFSAAELADAMEALVTRT